MSNRDITNLAPTALASGELSSASPVDRSAFRVLAGSSRTDERTRVLKQGNTFAVFDHYGDIKPGGLGEEGLYHEGTRYLSFLMLELEGMRPFCLSSSVREENPELVVSLTNPDLMRGDDLWLPIGTLHLALKILLWQAVCYEEVRIKNYGQETVRASLALRFKSDFADIFEVRGMKRKVRGEHLPPDVRTDSVVFDYRGRDGVARHTRLKFAPAPARLTSAAAHFDICLSPRQEITLDLSVACERGVSTPAVLRFPEARAESQADSERFSAWSCHLRTTNSQINAWVTRAVSDLHMLTSELPTGPYPYAGIPWFSTPFGRDGIITALECLWMRPGLARGVLAYLAHTQAAEVVPEEDAEPGKILHETRTGEMAAAKEMPFGRYYGSVDATPLFIVLAGAYYERTGDRTFLESLWPNIQAALEWIDRYGDRDGDGFVEYERQAETGLLHQGWKDSDDAIFHADGKPACGPVALCEVQGYVYAAWQAAALLAEVLGHAELQKQLTRKAAALREQFERAFWCEELSTYALALDGKKRPCRVRTSNAGQCLFTGIASPQHAARVARTLLDAESFSGWGVRTLAASETPFNPMGYHTGSVWPHDNALIAKGLARYGLAEKALPIWSGLSQAGLFFDLRRMPELLCGFAMEPGEGPVPYIVACSPQAWAAGSVLLLFQAILGLEINGPKRRIDFNRPQLPSSLRELRIYNLEVAGAVVDLLLVRHEDDVGLSVLRRDGDVQILVVK